MFVVYHNIDVILLHKNNVIVYNIKGAFSL